MGIGISVFLIAAGAIVKFAVEQQSTNGIDLDTVGVVLMVVGLIGLVTSALIFGPRTRRTTIETDAPAGRQYR